MNSITAETRTKEISIRKVMGATISGIAFLLSKDYLKMMGIAIVLAIPITAFLLDTLLPHIQHYHVSLTVWDVLVSVLVLMLLGMGTIVSQTYKTARLNPAATLKAE